MVTPGPRNVHDLFIRKEQDLRKERYEESRNICRCLLLSELGNATQKLKTTLAPCKLKLQSETENGLS